ncbi:MAG: hypothetical protein FJ279_24320 [Planctomycetes bacterium]|nr:hypothetical protein [Planctomycetota bacterium]
MAQRLHVDSIRVAFNDGKHNAFTDLCWFRGHIYLTFRSCPDGHGIFPTSRIAVMSSADGREWRRVFDFGVRDRDVRDPHFLVFRDTLFVYTGTWLCDPALPQRRDMNDHLGYGAWSRDGEAWDGPQSLEGTYGHYVWRAAACGGRAYLCGRRKRDFAHWVGGEGRPAITQSALLESEDGLVWRTAGLFAETDGNETAFLFEDDGALLSIVRGSGASPAQVCTSRPPYKRWTRVPLDRYIGGPLLVKWAGRCLVGGRKLIEPKNPKTTLYWLANDRLEEVAELPSGGDNSYPGFVPFSDTHGLLSYYSSHEGSGSHLPPSAIYLADLRLG